LFPFSLREKAKDWLLSLPKNSIDLWAKCKDAFIGRYYRPAKTIVLIHGLSVSLIMNMVLRLGKE
jgi:hypothetical protein